MRNMVVELYVSFVGCAGFFGADGGDGEVVFMWTLQPSCAGKPLGGV